MAEGEHCPRNAEGSRELSPSWGIQNGSMTPGVRNAEWAIAPPKSRVNARGIRNGMFEFGIKAKCAEWVK